MDIDFSFTSYVIVFPLLLLELFMSEAGFKASVSSCVFNLLQESLKLVRPVVSSFHWSLIQVFIVGGEFIKLAFFLKVERFYTWLTAT